MVMHDKYNGNVHAWLFIMMYAAIRQTKSLPAKAVCSVGCELPWSSHMDDFELHDL